MKSAFALFLVAAATVASSAFAETITCNEIPNATTQKYGYYERVEITFNSRKQITEIKDWNWNAKEDRLAGMDPQGSYDSRQKPLTPKKHGNELVYKYRYTEEGDGDYQQKYVVTYRVPLDFKGQVTLTEDDGSSNPDQFTFACP